MTIRGMVGKQNFMGKVAKTYSEYPTVAFIQSECQR
jgi:hypothetical protein